MLRIPTGRTGVTLTAVSQFRVNFWCVWVKSFDLKELRQETELTYSCAGAERRLPDGEPARSGQNRMPYCQNGSLIGQPPMPTRRRTIQFYMMSL